MLSSGPSGFQNAPITKSIIIISGSFTVLFSMLRLKPSLSLPSLAPLLEKLELWRLVTTHTFFDSPAETLFGVFLMYYFRLFERQMGSMKFGGFTFIVWLVSTLTEISYYVLFPSKNYVSSGPYNFIFACFVLFYFDIPSTYRFKICGINANDKLFTYILSLQLLFVNFPHSTISGLCGIFAGLAYRSDILRLNKFQFPPVINNFFGRVFLPMIQGPRPQQRGPIAIIPGGGRPQVSNPLAALQQQQDTVGSQGFADQLIPGNPLFNAANFQPVVRTAITDEQVTALTSMGFDREAVVQALERSNGDLHIATNLLLEGS